jgi:hypothetical protein
MTTAAEHRAGDRARKGSSRARKGSRPVKTEDRSPVKAEDSCTDGPPDRPKVAAASALTSAFHLLEGQLHPLTARAHPFRHPIPRYEDLCLIERVICLQRDLLETAAESEADSETLSALSTAIEVSLKRHEWDLGRSGRWLSPEARRRAEEAAARRFDEIAAELAGELGRAPIRPGRERALQTGRASRAAVGAPRPVPWPDFVAVAARGVVIASRRLSEGSRRVSVAVASRRLSEGSRRASAASRAQLARVARLPRNRGLTEAQAGHAVAAVGVTRTRAVGAVTVVVGLAALTGITGVLSGGPEGEKQNAYGSSGTWALHASSPDAHVTALAGRSRRGNANSRHDRQSRDTGRGHSRNGRAGTGGGGGGSVPPTASGLTTGTSTPYTGGDSAPLVSAPAPSYTSVSAPTTAPDSTSTSDGPVTSTVRNLDQAASDAGVNTDVSGTTKDVTGQVDRTVNNLSNDVSGATDGLLGN